MDPSAAGLALALTLTLGLALVDAAVLLARGGSAGAAAAAVALTIGAALALGAVLKGVGSLFRRLPDSLGAASALVAGAGAGALTALALFSGTGVRRLGLRPAAFAICTLLGVTAALFAWRSRAALRARWGAPWSPGARALWLLAAAAVYGAHAGVLTRQYPLAHAQLALACVTLVLVAARPLPSTLSARAAAPVAFAAVLALIAGATVSRSNVLRASLRQRAPLAQYPALLVGSLLRDHVEAVDRGQLITGPRLPLHGLDLVLVTVDALRADRLRALGGRGRMPALDAMAARGVMFRRAYCATPHTSYSLASMMMGTYARSVLALPGARRERGTMATWLGAAGYSTAAFFPPAVFAVDGDRFGSLRARRFGFAYADERFVEARERASDVARWLDGRRAGERVFVWVHLFEPHEPYVAHAEHPYGAEREQRYDAECSASDDAIGALVEAFRARGRRAAWVVSADHGEEFGDHGGSFHGTSVYDEQVRVPLVIEVPGVSARVVDEPVSLVDLAATLLGGVGLARPAGVRGNNLGALALSPAQGTRAFVATGSLRAVVTARDKLIADLSDGTLERYDLLRDPREQVNLADADPARTRLLRGELAAWEASHARSEAPRVGAEAELAELPDVLQRAVQGDRSVALDVARLLGSGGFAVRRAASRALGDLGVRDVALLDALARETEAPDADLRVEAGVSLALLGDARGAALARRSLDAAPLGSEARLRAALGLGGLGDHASVATLGAWALRSGATDAQRDACLEVLRALNDPASFEVWAGLLDDPRLAPRGAEALGALGDARALAPLRAALVTQRYPITQRAIALALAKLRAPDAAERARDAMGLGDPLADLWPLLDALGEPGVRISGAVAPFVLWRPQRVALQGGDRAQRARGVRRIYLRTRAEASATLTVAPGVQVAIAAGEHDTVIEAPRALPIASRWSASARIEVLRVAAP